MSAGRRFRLALAPLLRAGNAARVSRLASIALAIGAKPVSAVVRMRALVHMMLRARQAAWHRRCCAESAHVIHHNSVNDLSIALRAPLQERTSRAAVRQ